jgi:DNA polymerase elongation subunit (family B)
VLDTDGVNFIAPENEEQIEYIGKGLNPGIEAGKIYKGVEAVIAEFNDKYMQGEMGLSMDGAWPSTINLSRKNYALMEDDGEVKLTGNTIKSKKLPEYIEEFINNGFQLLLNDKGYEFYEYYKSYVKRILEYKIPLVKIASKAKVKKSIDQYINRGLNKKGQLKPKQAHMELAIQHNLKISLGDVIHYVNIGKRKSHGDVKVIDGKIGSKYIDAKDIESNPNLMGEYNAERYLTIFNNRVSKLFIVFDKSIRAKLKIKKLEDINDNFLVSDFKLCNGQPDKEDDQDTIEELFTPEPGEVTFWELLDYNPSFWINEQGRVRTDVDFKIPGLTLTS